MKRSVISTVLTVVALSTVLVSTGCGVVEGDEDVVAQVLDLSGPQGEKFRLCRDMEDKLNGHPASAWWVRDNENLVAVKFAGRIQCVDSVGAVRRSGITPIEDNEPACEFCGTPLPAMDLIDSEEDDDIGK